MIAFHTEINLNRININFCLYIMMFSFQTYRSWQTQTAPEAVSLQSIYPNFQKKYSNSAASSEFGTYRLCEQRRFRRAALRIRAVSPEPPLFAHTSSESRGTFKQKARSLAPLNGWACTVKICHDRMLEDTNSLDMSQLLLTYLKLSKVRS